MPLMFAMIWFGGWRSKKIINLMHTTQTPRDSPWTSWPAPSVSDQHTRFLPLLCSLLLAAGWGWRVTWWWRLSLGQTQQLVSYYFMRVLFVPWQTPITSHPYNISSISPSSKYFPSFSTWTLASKCKVKERQFDLFCFTSPLHTQRFLCHITHLTGLSFMEGSFRLDIP